MDETNYNLPEVTPNENTPKEITEILSDPKLFSAKIKKLAEELKKDQEITEQIKNYGAIKKFFINKAKIHTEAMTRLNGMMTDFFQILTATTFLTKGNSALLLGLYSSLCEDEKANNMEGNLFYNMAKDNLRMAIDSSENEQLREKALKIALVSARSNEEQLLNYKNSTHKRIEEAVTLVKEHINIQKEESDKHVAQIKQKLSEDILSTKKLIDNYEKNFEDRNIETNKSIRILTYIASIALAIGVINIFLFFLR